MKPRTTHPECRTNSLQAFQPPPAAMAKLSVVYQPVATLTSNPLNPRIHSPKQIRQIAKSIAAFGFNVPILVDEAGQVIAGHGRLLACEELGISDVPTVALSHLSESQKQAFLLAENRLVENAAWDQDLLAQNFAALTAVDLDFSLDVTGFEVEEIDLCLKMGAADKEGPDPDDAPVDIGPAVSHTGDLWLLGEHRLLCGDALAGESYDILMQGKRAAIVVSDNPYNVPIEGFVSSTGRHREFAQASGEMTPAEFTRFLASAFEHLARHSVEGALHYHFIDWRHQRELMDAAHGVYAAHLNVCVWAKTNGGLGSMYRSAHELVHVYKVGTAPHQNHIQLGAYGRYRTNLWVAPGASSGARDEDGRSLLDLHPTVKPTALIADILLDASSRRDIVVDVFAGSGTTIMAAERVGRIAYCMDIDPLYVDVTIRRFQRLTGRSAIHATLRCTFDELEEQRIGGGHA